MSKNNKKYKHLYGYKKEDELLSSQLLFFETILESDWSAEKLSLEELQCDSEKASGKSCERSLAATIGSSQDHVLLKIDDLGHADAFATDSISFSARKDYDYMRWELSPYLH